MQHQHPSPWIPNSWGHMPFALMVFPRYLFRDKCASMRECDLQPRQQVKPGLSGRRWSSPRKPREPTAHMPQTTLAQPYHWRRSSGPPRFPRLNRRAVAPPFRRAKSSCPWPRANQRPCWLRELARVAPPDAGPPTWCFYGVSGSAVGAMFDLPEHMETCF